jgi:hypothetical protein
MDRVRDQGSTGSCVGHALASAAYIRARVQGIECEHPSPVAIYTMARIYDKELGEPLDDERNGGARPAMAALALSDIGFVPESQWPLTNGTIDLMLPLDVIQTGTQHRLSEYQRINSTGEQRSEDVRTALSHGFPVTFATRVDRGFEDTNGVTPVGEPAGAGRGMHYVTIVGHSGGDFEVLNSWGIGFGNLGYCLVSDARVNHWTSGDFLAIVGVDL